MDLSEFAQPKNEQALFLEEMAPHLRDYARDIYGHTAEDVVQMGLLKLLDRPARDGNRRALARVIVHHIECTLHRLSETAKGATVSLDADTLQQAEEYGAFVDPRNDFDRELWVQPAIEMLPKQQADLIRLMYWDGMSLTEVAVLPDYDRGTQAASYMYVKRLHDRALASLKSLLKEKM
jgi:DNA-directed RNA polymerase specialized sigma24 family protein